MVETDWYQPPDHWIASPFDGFYYSDVDDELGISDWFGPTYGVSWDRDGNPIDEAAMDCAFGKASDGIENPTVDIFNDPAKPCGVGPEAVRDPVANDYVSSVLSGVSGAGFGFSIAQNSILEVTNRGRVSVTTGLNYMHWSKQKMAVLESIAGAGDTIEWEGSDRIPEIQAARLYLRPYILYQNQELDSNGIDTITAEFYRVPEAYYSPILKTDHPLGSDPWRVALDIPVWPTRATPPSGAELIHSVDFDVSDAGDVDLNNELHKVDPDGLQDVDILADLDSLGGYLVYSRLSTVIDATQLPPGPVRAGFYSVNPLDESNVFYQVRPVRQRYSWTP